jgi:fumarylacetoacetase
LKLGVSHGRIVEVRDGRYLGRGPGTSVLEPLGEVQGELDAVEWQLPFPVADYVDFYSSRGHAENMGRMFRPDAEPLTPNWLHLPIGYHGRAGTVVVSGTDVKRPHGHRGPGDFGPSRKLDIELELGFVIGEPSEGPVPVERALEHVFGVVLVNDWSARDIQAFEYVPLGPFLGKSFATSISPWVVTLDELARVQGEPQEPPPVDHLRIEPFAFDIPLEVELNGGVISRTNARHLYWNVAQQIAHLTSNGATLRRGDLLASGTISGFGEHERGSLIELTWNEGPFLEDGDEVVLRGEGLGEVRGRIVA